MTYNFTKQMLPTLKPFFDDSPNRSTAENLKYEYDKEKQMSE